MPYIRRDGELCADQVPLSRVAAAVGTPAYVYSWRSIRDRYQRLARALAAVEHRICYAVKANGALSILARLHALGAGFDVVSNGELERVLRAGEVAITAEGGPPGSVDTHVHVFENRYPLSPGRGYNPPESTLADLKHLHATLGVDRVVFTQPSIYGVDNSAIMDGMNALNAGTPDRARAIIACRTDITDEELAAFDAAGARGIRLNTDNKGGMPITFDQLPELAARIAPFGWHIEFLFPGNDILDLMPVFRALSVPMSIAHFAYQPATAGISAAGFRALLDLVREGNTWIKISGANRVSETDLPPYDDVRPMAQALVEAAEDRIVWGTDWPHPNKYEVNPNDGDLVDAFGDWITDEALRRKIMVDTPAAFYRF